MGGSAVLALAWSDLLVAQEAVPLALKFRQGQVLRYHYEESLTYTPPSKFVGALGYKLESKVDYSLKVSRVGDDGTASLKITLERLALVRDGRQICDLTVLPRDADEVAVTIKPNAEIRFYKDIYVVMNRSDQLEFRIATGGNPLAVHVLSTDASEKFHFEADVDEGEGVIKVGVPPTRALANPDYGRLAELKVDLTPRKLLELLLLPTMPMAEGQTLTTAQKYVAQEKLTFKGQSTEGSHQGSLVEIEVSPWVNTEGESSGSGLLPALSGNLRYLIDGAGKLVSARGVLKTSVVVPGVGEQVGDSRIELILKK